MRELRTIEVDKWVPSEKKGMVKHAGMISPYNAFTQLRGHLENMDLMPEEYFSMNPWEWKRDGFDEELPDYIRAECSVHWGGNEGIYMDIALLYRDEKNNLKRMDFATGKTLGSSGDDYLRMSRIAAECSMMLNGRGEIVRFYEDERAFNAKALKEYSKEPLVEEITFDKARVAKLVGKYIEELECQEVPREEIVELLLGDFTRSELEALGHGEFIEDYFQDERSENSVDGLIAEAVKSNLGGNAKAAEMELSR